MSSMGQAMRIGEILGILVYYGSILTTLDYTVNFSTIQALEGLKLRPAEPECLQRSDKYKQMAGNTLEWFQIELMTFILYMLTMMILLIKSRCSKVGVD